MANIGTEFMRNGVTEATPANALLGAGTVHIGLEFSGDAWNAAESLLCATSGGNKIEIKPELYDIPADDVGVKTDGLTVKVGETAIMEISPLELTNEIMRISMMADENASTTATGYTELTSSPTIPAGAWLENVAFVGKHLDGRPMIVLFEKALCTSGFSLESKSKEAAVPKLTFECYAELGSDGRNLPYHIYYPTPAASA